MLQLRESQKRIILEDADKAIVTLNGERARIVGIKLPYAIVRSLVTHKEARFSWPCVCRTIKPGKRCDFIR